MSSYWGRRAAASLLDSFPPVVRNAIREIESLEEEWVVPPPDESHSYGRIPGEKEIRLWSVPRTTAALLYWFAVSTNCCRAIEIGTSAGMSTLWIAQGLSGCENAHLDTWEILPDKATLAASLFRRAHLDEIIRLWNEDARGFDERYAFPGEVDFVFLDADKENYHSYLVSSHKVLRPGGILVVDNAVDHGGLMFSLHEGLVNSSDWATVVLDMDNGLLLSRKT